MIYLALLRGINVGGKNKVEMARLRDVVGSVGFGKVSTYINSGNVIFTEGRKGLPRITTELEKAIESEFGFSVIVLVRDIESLTAVAAAIPDDWVSDKTMRCDVMFLSDDIDDPGIVDELPVKAGIDTVFYVPGAIVWHVDVENINRSGRTNILGGVIYKRATVRNANTVRKLASLMHQIDG